MKSPEDKYLKSIEDYQKLLAYLKRIANYSDSIIPFFFSQCYKLVLGLVKQWQ